MLTVKIRYYHPDDFESIKEISSHIWEGQDYLPRKINQFHEDPKSHPLVVEVEGRIVSVGNMRFIRDDLVWLEAIRTHPDVRGKGYGRMLSEKHLKIARELGAREAWLSTGTENKATAKMLKNLDFEEIYLFNLWQADEESQEELDEKGKLLSIDSLGDHVSGMSREFLTKWTQIRSFDEILRISKTIDNNEYNMILGEFKAFPIDSYESLKWIESGSMYYLDDPPSLLTINPSSERDNLVVLGVTTNSADVVGAALLFAQKMHPDTRLKLFYSSSVDNPLFEEKRKMRIMRFIL